MNTITTTEQLKKKRIQDRIITTISTFCCYYFCCYCFRCVIYLYVILCVRKNKFKTKIKWWILEWDSSQSVSTQSMFVQRYYLFLYAHFVAIQWHSKLLACAHTNTCTPILYRCAHTYEQLKISCIYWIRISICYGNFLHTMQRHLYVDFFMRFLFSSSTIEITRK